MPGFDSLEVQQAPFKVFLTHPVTGADLLVKDGDHAGDQAYIEVHGYNSPAGEPFKKKAMLRSQTRGTRKPEVNLDKLREENADTVSALTISWLLVDFDGAIIEDECNRANARRLYSNPKTGWIVRQVLEGLNEEANFIQA